MMTVVFSAFYVLAAYLAADFITGMFHWWEDRYGDPAWPVVGKLVVEPNILHHKTPTAFAKGNYFFRNWTTLVPTLGLAVVCYMLGNNFAALVFLFASQSNEIHCWAHVKTNRLIRRLQRTGFLQSPRSHAVHHRRPYDQNYCVMTDFFNPLLTRIGFWVHLEAVVGLFGIHPREERRIY